MKQDDDIGLFARHAPALLVVLMASIIIWSVSTIQSHAIDIAKLEESISLLQIRPIPPPWVEKRLDGLGRELERIQRQIDRIEGVLPEVTKKPLPPYTKRYESHDQGYSPTLWLQDEAGFCGADCRSDWDCDQPCPTCYDGVCGG